MKRLFSLISAILCVSLMAMSVSAAVDVNAYKIFKTAMDKMIAAKTLDIKVIQRSTYDTSKPQEISTAYARLKLINTGDGSKLRADIAEWDDEYSMRMFVKDGYVYEPEEMEKSSYMASEYTSSTFYRELYYNLAGTSPEGYKSDLTGLTVENAENGGYILRYTSRGDRYILVLDKDYTPQLLSYLSESSYSKQAMRCTIAVNGPVTIDFPSDLGMYEDE